MSEECYVYMIEKKRKLTECEKKFKKMLDKYNIQYQCQVQFRMKIENNKTKIYVVDFLIENTIIEIDGNTHTHKKEIELDRLRDSRFLNYGYSTIRFTNDEVRRKNKKIDKILKKFNNY